MPRDYHMLDLPPGMFANGTLYGARGAWVEGSRVRWHNNALRPIGGWTQFQTSVGNLAPVIVNPALESARALLSWKSNDGSSYHAVGTNLGLYAFHRSSASVFAITPVDFTPRPAEVTSSDGYGDWIYGDDAYGTQRPYDEDTVGTFGWCLRNWGEYLLAAPRGAPSKLYEWDLNTTGDAEIVLNAPTNIDCFHVTAQRIVMTAGDDAEPRMVKWCTTENNTVWAPSSTNQAGSQHLPGVGKFLEIVTVQDLELLVSETDAYIGRYVGPPYVYGFDQVGTNCGAVSGASVVATDTFAMWPGKHSFFMFDGANVSRVTCKVMDHFVRTRSDAHLTKMHGFVNPDWPEIWWLYQSGSGDLDSYLYYDYKEGHWAYGMIDRSCGGGFSATGGLLMVSTIDGLVYTHEQEGTAPYDVSPAEVYAKTGPIELAKGARTQYVKSIQPDFISDGEVDITIIGQDRPGGPKVNFGPYSIGYPATGHQPVPVRARGHTVSLLLEGKDGLWTLGTLRLDLHAGGEK